MYSSEENSQAHGQQYKRSSIELLQKYHPLAGNENFQFQYPMHRMPSHYHDFSQGPISAPAMPYNSEDYFSRTPGSTELPVDTTEPMQSHELLHPRHFKNRSHLVPHTALLARRYSGNKIRNRSNLSQSYMEEPSPHVPESLFARRSQIYSHYLDTSAVEKSPPKAERHSLKKTHKPKPGKNPGFFLKLDDLNPSHSPLNRVRNQHDVPFGSVSGPNFGIACDNMEFFDSDAFIQSGISKVGQPQEDNTPLMFPPQAEELGYFGDRAPANTTSSVGNTGIPGEYLNVTARVYDPAGQSGTSGNNSDIDSYLNYQVEDYDPGQNFENNAYHENVREYRAEAENTTADARFTPVSGYHQHGNYSQTYGHHQPGIHSNKQHYSADLHIELGPGHSDQPLPDESYNHPSNYQSEHHNYSHDHVQSQHERARNFNPDAKYSHEQYAGPSYSNPRLGRVIPHQQTDDGSGGSMSEQLHQSSYRDYSYEKQAPYNKPESRSSTVFDGDSLSDSPNVAQAVESSDTDHAGPADRKIVAKKRKGAKGSKGIVCSVCDKFIVRDFSRHLRIHDEAGRFQCCFPPGYCKHKSRKFNRPYDYKKHLLNIHFKFNDPAVKLAVNLTEKLHVNGQCNTCGQQFLANDWLESHILTTDLAKKCPELQRMESLEKIKRETETYDGA